MQFPSVSCRPNGQQFWCLDFGRKISLVQSDDGKLVLKQGGDHRFVSYTSPPLPLTPPNTRTPYDLTDHYRLRKPTGSKFSIYNQLLYFYTNHPDVRLPVAIATDMLQSPTPVSHGSCLNVSFLSETTMLLLWASGPDLRTLGVGILSCVASGSTLAKYFLDWTREHAPLRLNPVEALSMPGQIKHIEVKRIKGKDVVCVQTNHHICFLRVHSGSPGLHLECFSLHQTQQQILFSATSPYIVGECVIATESGGLYLLSKRSKGTILASPAEVHPIGLCFGAHPRSIVVARGNHIVEMDWRSTPLSSKDVLTTSDQITCLSCDPHDPYRIVVATVSLVIVLDARQPNDPLLSVQHNMLFPPTSITTALGQQGVFVVLSTCSECQVLAYGQSSPVRSTVMPHSVTNIRSIPTSLWRARLSCDSLLSHVTHRMMHPLIGTSLVSFSNGFLAAVVITDLGDIFYQSWTYNTAPQHGVTLGPSCCHGYDLWIKEAFAQEQDLRSYCEHSTTKSHDLSPTLIYLLSDTALCIKCHHVLKTYLPHLNLADYTSRLATSDAHCSFCGALCELPLLRRSTPLCSARPVLSDLKETCTSLHINNDLDCALYKGWPSSN